MVENPCFTETNNNATHSQAVGYIFYFSDNISAHPVFLKLARLLLLCDLYPHEYICQWLCHAGKQRLDLFSAECEGLFWKCSAFPTEFGGLLAKVVYLRI